MNDEIGELDTTIDEWRAALEMKDDPGKTIGELMRAMNLTESTLRRKLTELIFKGKCVKGKAFRKADGTGLCTRWNVYHLIGEEK